MASLHDSPFPCLVAFLNTFSISTVWKLKGTSQIDSRVKCAFTTPFAVDGQSSALPPPSTHLCVWNPSLPYFCCLSPSLSLITFLSWLFIYLLLPCRAIFPSSENTEKHRKLCKGFVFNFLLTTTRISSSLYHLSKTKISAILFEITLGRKAWGN